MSDRVTDLAFEIADGAARADIETMCTYASDCLFDPQNAEEFRAVWIDISKVTDPSGVPFVAAALEYLELRGMLNRCHDNPDWLRVRDEPTIARVP